LEATYLPDSCTTSINSDCIEGKLKLITGKKLREKSIYEV